MAGVVNTARLSARIAGRYAPRTVSRRGFHASSRSKDAQNYAMPALSPTMTEGNIAAWRVKEGDSFAAGDVLLEIETDKATMDVEAQDDGILMKITMPDGSKGVKVGHRIAVTAEPGDDISALELPADNSNASSGQSKAKEESQPSKSETSRKDAQASSEKSEVEGQQGSKTESAPSAQPQEGGAREQKYPLYPSVEHLLHHNGLSAQDAGKIPATGPGGRLLKGDVLAYLGKIDKDYSARSSARLEKLSHLDLSDIQLAPRAQPKTKEPEKQTEPELPEETEIALPISLTAALETQKRVKDTIGIHVPLTTFIVRASALANDDLPVGKKRKPTADELFNAVLGLDTVPRTATGNFFPDIVDLSPVEAATPRNISRTPDIIDILSSKPARPVRRRAVIPAVDTTSSAERVFTVVAKNGQENQANEYLERMKLSLEQDPGRLLFL